MGSRSELPGVARAAAAIIALARRRGPTLGQGRLICLEGPAGSGKTTLAREIGVRTGGTVIHLDDLYDGWAGIEALSTQLPSILAPLDVGDPGSYRRYDWGTQAYAETVTVSPAPWLILEGVGSGSRMVAEFCTVLVYLSAPADLRLARGIARDGADALPHWEQWMSDEAAMLDRERPADRADVLVDGTGLTSPVLTD